MDSENLRIERMNGTEDISDAVALRKQIFIMEQGVTEAREADGLDGAAEHYVGYFLGESVAVARVRYENLETAKLERMGVLESMRGEGTGALLMDSILDDLKREGVKRVVLDSQVHAQGFYARFGFETVGQPFIEEGTDIEHVAMAIDLEVRGNPRLRKELKALFTDEALRASAVTLESFQKN